MTTKEYTKACLITENRDFDSISPRFIPDRSKRLLHALLGMCTEVGEIQDKLKKYLFYGKQIEQTGLVEEIGDLLWYIGLACEVLEVPMSKIMELNIAKLKARYSEKFTEEKAINRDTKQEMLVFENDDNLDKRY